MAKKNFGNLMDKARDNNLPTARTFIPDTESQQRVTTEKQDTVIKSHKTRITESYQKVTIFLSNNDIEILEKIRAQRLKAGCKRSEVDKSKLIREAIQLLGLQNSGKL